MKFALWIKDQGDPDTAARREVYDEEDDPQQYAEEVIATFNRCLKPGECPRVLVRIELLTCCDKPRMCKVSAKCSDLFDAEIELNTHEGYVPDDLGIGGGDYVKFKYCLNCGKIEGSWPLDPTDLEHGCVDGMQTCGDCDGEGTCSACDGTGDEDGETCENCDGSGHCGTCEGSGKVEI